MLRCLCAWACLCTLVPAQAHLMVAQKGTLNFSGGGAYLLLSLPVSALSGVDDNADGLLSQTELRAHTPVIEAQVRSGIQLTERARPGGRAFELQGLMFTLSPPDSTPSAPASQLVVMGRFALEPGLSEQPHAALTLAFSLFGAVVAEQSHDITFTWGAQSRAARFTPERPVLPVFLSAWAVLGENVWLGFAHVMAGWDHLLFLLLVLLSMAGARFSWRTLLLTLSCFTVGHGVTLFAAAKGWLVVSPALVEPAIAATVVMLALFDLWQRRQSWPMTVRWRLALVFACAMVHGLGLASALGDLGQDVRHLLLALAGFNLGIEAAQVAFSAVVVAAVVATRRFSSASTRHRVANGASIAAVAVGTWWLVARVAG